MKFSTPNSKEMVLRNSQTMDTIQHMTTLLKHYETKLEKLQDDLTYQGQTLSNLRILVMNLTTGFIGMPDQKLPDQFRDQLNKVTVKRNDKANPDKTSNCKKKNVVDWIANLKAKSDTLQQKGASKKPTDPQKTGKLVRHAQRHKKAENVSRKAESVKARNKKKPFRP